MRKNNSIYCCDNCRGELTPDDCFPVMYGERQVGVACCSTCQGEAEVAHANELEYQYECGIGSYWEDFQ